MTRNDAIFSYYGTYREPAWKGLMIPFVIWPVDWLVVGQLPRVEGANEANELQTKLSGIVESLPPGSYDECVVEGTQVRAWMNNTGQYSDGAQRKAGVYLIFWIAQRKGELSSCFYNCTLLFQEQAPTN